ncbi:hypothetical protein BYT27DRAFT_7334031 [Phlegmacium glaucopus]|nr:hypothetical protein BYT27DRAFT_7334031 [Phlegmacium glaucopus]
MIPHPHPSSELADFGCSVRPELSARETGLNSNKSFELYTTIVVRQDLPKNEKLFFPYFWFSKGLPHFMEGNKNVTLPESVAEMIKALQTLGWNNAGTLALKAAGRQVVLSKEFNDHERFLGEHRWSEMLIEPGAEEKKQRLRKMDGKKLLSSRPGSIIGLQEQVLSNTRTHEVTGAPFQTNKQCRPLPADKIPLHVSNNQFVSWTQTKNAGASTSMACDVLLALLTTCLHPLCPKFVKICYFQCYIVGISRLVWFVLDTRQRG